MSLLLEALKQAERGSDPSLEPMDTPKTNSATPPSAQAAADLMFAKQAAAERKRLTILLLTLATVVVGMGVYFYLAIYMPWIFLPRPQTSSPPPVTAPPTVAPAPPALGAARDGALSTAPLAANPAPGERALPLPQDAPTGAPHKMPAAIAAVETPRAPPVRKTRALQIPAPESAIGVVSENAPRDDASARRDDGVRVVPGSVGGNSGLIAAYETLRAGRLEDARHAYEKLAAADPRNPDILLGLALIAQRQGRADDAVQGYLRALEADPKNSFAQASLTGMVARADPAAAEAKFKSLLAQQSAPYLYFGLGNIYAAQGKWPEAQQAYFDAQKLAPENPDYAFNLAVSLEHIRQVRPALDYYARALMLARAQGGASFDPTEVKARIQRLNKSVPGAAAN